MAAAHPSTTPTRSSCSSGREPERRPSAERGVALLASILILALLAAVTAATLWLTQSELWVAGSARAFLQARYTAEAGVWHALSLIAPGTDFAALVAGSGGLADPRAPGPLPFADGGFVAFPGPPFGYAVTVHPVVTERVRLRSSATAVRGARRTVLATVGRELLPYAPAALVVGSGRATIAPSLGGLAPEEGGIAIDAATPVAGAQAIVAAGTAEAAEGLRASFASAGATLVGGTPWVRARPLDIAAFVLASGLAEQTAGVLAANQGAPGAPVRLRVGPGTAPRLVGHGTLFVRGPLELDGDVDWSGVLLVDGELRIAASSCRISGMVWAQEVSFATGCAVRFDLPAVLEADSAARLPRRPTLLALDDA